MKAPHYRTVNPTEGSPQQLIIKPAVRTMCGGNRGMLYLVGIGECCTLVGIGECCTCCGYRGTPDHEGLQIPWVNTAVGVLGMDV